MVNIIMGKPYWQQPTFIFLIVVLALVIAWISYIVTSRMLNKRRDYLQRLIDERTKDLQQEILLLGGYSTSNQENILVISPKLQPLPLELLNPYDFQRFCAMFLDKLYPTATVHLY